MNVRRSLPATIMARLSLGSVPVDGYYWFESGTWLDRTQRVSSHKRTDRPSPGHAGRQVARG